MTPINLEQLIELAKNAEKYTIYLDQYRACPDVFYKDFMSPDTAQRIIRALQIAKALLEGIAGGQVLNPGYQAKKAIAAIERELNGTV